MSMINLKTQRNFLALVVLAFLISSFRESESLPENAVKIGNNYFELDSLFLQSAPESRFVPAGMKFQTRIFLAATFKQKPLFDGDGTVTPGEGRNWCNLFIDSKSGFEPGTNQKKQAYSATAILKSSSGNFIEYKVEDYFTVTKPEVVIVSDAVQNLYFNCKNAIKMDVPALGEYYHPQIEGKGAEVIQDPEHPIRLTVMPFEKSCTLSVNSNTNGQLIHIDDIRYSAISPPFPSIWLTVNGYEYDRQAEISLTDSVGLKIYPEEEFGWACPQDARYQIDYIDLLIENSPGAPLKVGSINVRGRNPAAGIPISMKAFSEKAAVGKKVFFQIHQVSRINYNNRPYLEKFAQGDLVFQGVLK